MTVPPGSRERNQYEHLAIGVAEVFKRRGDGQQATIYGTPQLDVEEKELTREIFWDLFRQGIITLGCNDSN